MLHCRVRTFCLYPENPPKPYFNYVNSFQALVIAGNKDVRIYYRHTLFSNSTLPRSRNRLIGYSLDKRFFYQYSEASIFVCLFQGFSRQESVPQVAVIMHLVFKIAENTVLCFAGRKYVKAVKAEITGQISSVAHFPSAIISLLLILVLLMHQSPLAVYCGAFTRLVSPGGGGGGNFKFFTVRGPAIF